MPERMDRDQAIELLPGGCRQRIVGRARVGELGGAVEVGDVGEIGALQAMLDAGVTRALRLGMDRTELGREIDLLRIVELLPMKHDDRIAVDGAHDGVAVGGWQRPREVGIRDPGEEPGSCRRNGDAPNRLPRL